jgi:small conductance mechanosensitive channel
MEKITDQLIVFATTYGLKIVGAILILIFGRFFAGVARKMVRRIAIKSNLDDSIVSFLSSLTFFLVIAFAVIAALAKFGMQTASFVAVLGAAGFAVGFALQGSLSNFAAGVMILIFRPFKIGDLIEAAGILGIVQDIHLFNTILATLDNVKIILPNGKIYGDVIKNISGYDTRRLDLEFGIGYSSSIQKAYDVISNIIKEDARILPEPKTQIAVSELADSSVNFVVRPWVKQEDYWDVKFGLNRQVKEAFDSQGIEIPFPQRVVHMSTEGEN